MPKKTFRSNNSTVVINRNKFGGNAKRKVAGKRRKLIFIDEKNETNWKYLKAELGYKTDSLFLEHLLDLARKELKLFRPKKHQPSNENEDTLRISDHNTTFKHEKQSKLLTTCKTEGKRPVPCVEDKEKVVVKINGNRAEMNQNFIDEHSVVETESEEIDDSTPAPIKILLATGCNSVGKVKGSKMTCPTDESIQNSKTETAKDLYLDCNTLRNRPQIVDDMSAIKDLNLCSVQDKNCFMKCKKKSSAIEQLSSHKSKSQKGIKKGVLKNEKSCSKLNDTHASEATQVSNNVEMTIESESKIYTDARSTCSGSSESSGQLTKYESCKSPNTNIANQLQTTIKINLCAICNTSHIVGSRCLEETTLSEKDKTSDFVEHKYEYTERENKCMQNDDTEEAFCCQQTKMDKKSVYDFEESEREINIEESSRWCQKLLKADEAVQSVVEETRALQGTGTENCLNSGDEGHDSDSSHSGPRLRIDESYVESVSFAESSLPDSLAFKTFDDVHGQSVYTKSKIAKCTYFGPLVGEKVKEMDIPDDFNMKFIWEVNSADGVFYLNTKNPETSNWLCFLRPANSRDSANLMSTVKENQLYFLTTKDVREGDELLYWMDDTHSAWSKKKLDKKNCGGCNIQFTNPLYYRKHCMIFHDPSCSLTIRKYHCKICGLAVLGKEKIMKHAAEMHQGKGAYQCQYCRKFFLRLNYLEMHRTYGCSKNPQRSRPLCDLCGRKFCQPQKLKVHIKRMHSDMAQVLKDFQCKSCLKILGSRAALQRHMKEVHNKDIIGACTCDRCGKMFQNKSNLKIHMLTHSGVKPFRCQQTDCTAAFTTKQCLQFHYKKVHGFTDDVIPKIERSIAYTFDAYSGGTVTEPGRCHSPKFEDHLITPLPEQRECGLDLSFVASPADSSKAKEKTQVDNANESSAVLCGGEDTKSGNSHRYLLTRGESASDNLIQEQEEESDDDGQGDKIIVNKGSKKWIVSEGNQSDGVKSIFRHESANASLLVEAAISAAEKDIIDKPVEEQLAGAPLESRVENPYPSYSVTQYTTASPEVYDPSEKKTEIHGKKAMEVGEADPAAKKVFCEKSGSSEFMRCSSLLRINTSPVSEMPKDYNISSLIRDQETTSFADIEIQDYRNRDLLESYRESENFHEQYRAHDMYRPEKLDMYRSAEFDLRMSSTDKMEYRDFDVSNDAYRSLASNLEKYRSADVYRFRTDGYDLGVGYREQSEEKDGEAQNLCLKEKSFQYETLEELARIGRDNPGAFLSGFECLLVSDTCGGVGNQSFGTGAPRGLHGMLSPRTYHPTYEGESVDLSVPRPSYSSSPIYTLDLTQTRVELPIRHLDFRSHLGLSPHRYPNSRLPGLSNGASQLSPTGYSVYSSPYVASTTARHSPTSQFQPYTSLYY